MCFGGGDSKHEDGTRECEKGIGCNDLLGNEERSLAIQEKRSMARKIPYQSSHSS
jgi:hypothetical protein